MKIKQHLSALLLTLTLACSNQEAIYGEAPKQAEAIPSSSTFKLSTRGNIDGTRIKHMSLTGADGSETYLAAYDSVLDTFCEFKINPDLSPSYFCYPLSTVTIGWGDDKCLGQLYVPAKYAWPSLDGKVREVYSREASFQKHFVERMDITAPVTKIFYQKDDRSPYSICIAQDPTPETLYPVVKSYTTADLVGAM